MLSISFKFDICCHTIQRSLHISAPMEVEDERFEPFRKLLTEIPLTTAEQAGFVCPGGGRETDRVTAGSISVGRKPLKTKVHPLPDRDTVLSKIALG